MVDGFSSADPTLSKGEQGVAVGGGIGAVDPATTRRSRSRRKASTPKVSIAGDTVMIDGQGFSVAPSKQESFIQSRTGGRGSSATAALTLARFNEAQRLASVRSSREATIRGEQASRARQVPRSQQEQMAAAFAGTQVLTPQQAFTQRQSRADQTLGQGVADRMGAIETTADRLPTSTRDVGEVPASVPDLQFVEQTTGPDSIDTMPPAPLEAEPFQQTRADVLAGPTGVLIEGPGNKVVEEVQRTGALLSVEPFDPEAFAEAKSRDAERLTIRQATSSIFKGDTKEDTKSAIRDLISLEVSPAEVVSEFLSPFKKTGGRKGDKKFEVPQFGTITDVGPTRTTTGFELEKELQLERGTDIDQLGLSQEARITGKATGAGSKITEKFQSKIDVGDITLEDAQSQASKEFAAELGDIISTEAPSRQNLQTRGGERFVAGAGLLADIGLFEAAARKLPGRAAKAVDRGAIKELAATKSSKFVGVVEKDIDDAFLKLKGGRVAGPAKQTVEIEGKIFDLGGVDDITKAAFRGKGKTTTELDSFVKRVQGFKGEEAKITTIEDFGVVARGRGQKTKAEITEGSIRKEFEGVQSRGFVDILPEKSFTREFGVRSIKAPAKKKGIKRLADIDSTFAKRIQVTTPRTKKVALTGRRTSQFIGGADDTSKSLIEFAGGQAKKTKIAIPSARMTSVADIDSIGIIKRVPKIKRAGLRTGRGAGPKRDVSEFDIPGVGGLGKKTLAKVAKSRKLDLDAAVGAITPGVARAGRSALKLKQVSRGGAFAEFSGGATASLAKRTVLRKAPRAFKSPESTIKLQAKQQKALVSEFLPASIVSSARGKRGARKSASALASEKAFKSLTSFNTRQRFDSAFKLKKANAKKQKFTSAPFTFPPFLRPARVGRAGGAGLRPKIEFDFDSAKAARKKDSKRALGDEAEFFTPGFTEKVLGITKKITRKEARRIARSGDPFRQRAIPQFLD